MSEDREPFLSRWSRKKVEAREDPAQPAAEGDNNAPLAPATNAEPPAPLQAVESLTTESDFKPFMGADVAPETRRAALKKLFADAHYNVHDPFEAYMGDYTKEDPIPLEMIKRLDHARSVLFEDKPPVEQAAAADPQAESKPESLDGAAKQDA
jgi:Protein of unknown function (DUF3306)